MTKHLGYIAATLPSRKIDMDSAQKRVAVYAKVLDGYSNDAISFMSLRVCQTLKWFPTPSECLEILRLWVEPHTARERAFAHCRNFNQFRFHAWLARLDDGPVEQSMIDEVPDQWRRAAEAQSLLRKHDDGSYTQRLRKVPA